MAKERPETIEKADITRRGAPSQDFPTRNIGRQLLWRSIVRSDASAQREADITIDYRWTYQPPRTSNDFKGAMGTWSPAGPTTPASSAKSRGPGATCLRCCVAGNPHTGTCVVKWTCRRRAGTLGAMYRRPAAENGRAEVALGLALWALYVWGASGSGYWFDAGEAMAAVIELTFIHPPGSPFYTLVTYPFTLLPIGPLPFRVALGSAACLALGWAFLLRVLRAWLRAGAGAAVSLPSPLGQTAAATLAVLLLAGSAATFWQALRPEVYGLHFCIAMAALYVGRRSLWRHAERNAAANADTHFVQPADTECAAAPATPTTASRSLAQLGLLLAAGLANHHLLALVCFALLGAAWWVNALVSEVAHAELTSAADSPGSARRNVRTFTNAFRAIVSRHLSLGGAGTAAGTATHAGAGRLPSHGHSESAGPRPRVRDPRPGRARLGLRQVAGWARAGRLQDRVVHVAQRVGPSSAVLLSAALLCGGAYLLLPLRSGRGTVNLGVVDSFQRFFWYVSAQVYQGNTGAGVNEASAKRAVDLLVALGTAVPWPLWLLVTVGVYASLRIAQLRPALCVAGLLFGGHVALRLWLGHISDNPDALGYLLPGLAALALPAALAAAGLLAGLAALGGRVQRGLRAARPNGVSASPPAVDAGRAAADTPSALRSADRVRLEAGRPWRAAGLMAIAAGVTGWTVYVTSPEATIVHNSLRTFHATDYVGWLGYVKRPPRAAELHFNPQTTFMTWGLNASEAPRPDLVTLPVPFLAYAGVAEATSAEAPRLAPLVVALSLADESALNVTLDSLAPLLPLYLEADPRVPETLRGQLAAAHLSWSFNPFEVPSTQVTRSATALWQVYTTLYSQLPPPLDRETQAQLLWRHYNETLIFHQQGALADARLAAHLAAHLNPWAEPLATLRRALANAR